MSENDLINKYESDSPGIEVEISGGAWTVSILNYLPRLAARHITNMHRHIETDECFILLKGRAVLFAANGSERPGTIEAYIMEPGSVYRVPKGTWHTQAMNENSKILLVENNGTTADNSPRAALTPLQKEQIVAGAESWLL